MAVLGSPINASNSIQMYERLEEESKSDYGRNYDTLKNAQIVENSREKSAHSKIKKHNKRETEESVPYERLNSKHSQCQNVYDTLQNKQKGEYFAQQNSMSKACGKIAQTDKKFEETPGYETLNSARDQNKSYDILKKSQSGDYSRTQSVERKERRQAELILEINSTFHASQKSEHSYCSPLHDMDNIDLEQERSYAYASFPSNSQNKKDKNGKTVKHQTRKHIASFLIGFIFGGVVFGIIVFAVLKIQNQDADNGNCIFPGNGTSNESSCVWTVWTQWSDCSVLCGNGTQHRNRQHNGGTEGCLPRTENQTKSCNLGGIGCQAPAIDMHFDPATLNSECFLSIDNRILSNRHHSSQTPKRSSEGDKSLKKYSGVIANRCFGVKKKVWFKVAYTYTIERLLSFTNLILEVGLADRNEIDNHYFVGNVQTKGWSFALARCGEDNDDVCLRSKHRENLLDNIFFSRNIIGLHKNGTFDLVLDRQNNTFQLQDLSATHSNISFENVVSVNELCPVFGVYGSNMLDVQIQILDSKDLTNS
ncbi:uncharacterized protein LOC127708561 isoform X4 [Mytilus californianus]|uniref:uncharacterized protein LOC127708561 isoform X4 n=1 Tax=Mytilus californianus TaxID=6549 RepID=UPI0022450A71|nr:uncharacterized protein LOC127708561 isoform X4 [Mytilus californianus]